MPRMDRILCRSLTSRGEPPDLSSHFVKSISLTSCSTRTSAPSDYLGFYAEPFQTVEIDSTFYVWRLTRTWPDFALTVP